MKNRELRWVTTCLTSAPTEESAPRYADLESCVIFVAIDILTHNDDIRHSGFKGETIETARGLLVLVACALQYLHKTQRADYTFDPSSIEDLAGSFSFSEIRKRIMHTRLSSVLCDTIDNKDTLLNRGGIILPLGNMTLFLTFAPTADVTIRTSLPKEIRLALGSHKTLV